MSEFKRRVLNALISLDQFLWCVLTLGNADPDMTLSASAYRSEINGKLWARIARPVIDMLFFFDPMHCHKSYLAELNRRQVPPDMRQGSD